jgi:putative photosynthetic complex assembly protein
MTTHSHDSHAPVIPRPVLLGAGALVLVTLLVAGASRLAALTSDAPEPPSTLLRELRFADLPDGGVAVIDGRSGRQIEAVQGEQGFLRGVLRGLAHERLRHDVGAQPAFHLIAGADGRLKLADPVTGRRIDLESFGRDNALIFLRWARRDPVPSPARSVNP